MYLDLMYCENLMESGTENMGGFRKNFREKKFKGSHLHFTDIVEDMILYEDYFRLIFRHQHQMHKSLF